MFCNADGLLLLPIRGLPIFPYQNEPNLDWHQSMKKESTNQEIGQRIREFALSRYDTLAAFARALGINQVHLSAYMTGRYRPGGKLQARLREAGMNIDWLMTGEIPTIPQQLRGISLSQSFRVGNVPPPKKGLLPPAGHSQETEPLDFSESSHFFLRATKEVALGLPILVQEGDLLLLNLYDTPKNGDLAAARWGSHFAVGYYQDTDNIKILRFLNPEVLAALLPESAAVFPVVLIKKR